MTTMKHGRYVANIDYDPEIDSFFGEVVNTRDTITFYGRSIPELKKEFGRSIEAHVEFCKRQGIDPGKPYSGRIPLRIPADLHRKLDADAALHGMSLNAYIKRTLEEDTAESD
jgi:predicted HicB family RNase H-like nuclease